MESIDMGDKIHPTHFQVPEMPWKRKDKPMDKKIIIVSYEGERKETEIDLKSLMYIRFVLDTEKDRQFIDIVFDDDIQQKYHEINSINLRGGTRLVCYPNVSNNISVAVED